MKMKKKMLFAALLTAASFAVGCTVTPTSSTPISSTAPVSSVPSAPGSATEASSSAEASPELHLEYNPAILQCTIASDCAYVDASGTLHYYPEFLKTGDIRDRMNPAPLDPTGLPDETSNVRSIYSTWGAVYAVMKDGTVKAQNRYMNSQQIENEEQFVDEAKPILDEVPTWKNVFALNPVGYGGYSMEVPVLPLIYLVDANGHNILKASDFLNDIGCTYLIAKEDQSHVVNQITVSNSTAILCDNGHVYTYFDQICEITSEWEDIVQIAYSSDTLLGLKADGTLLQVQYDFFSSNATVQTGYVAVPEQYCKGVMQLFELCLPNGAGASGLSLIQLADGTVYYPYEQKDLGKFEPLDQVFTSTNGLSALTQSGKVIRLTNMHFSDEPDFTDWLQSQTHLPATVGRK